MKSDWIRQSWCCVSLKTRWKAVRKAWVALRVELQGQYSVERMHRLKAYSESATMARFLIILLVTPLPCFAVMLLLDSIPLRPPESGLEHSHALWLRIFLYTSVVNFVILLQVRYFVVRLPITLTIIVCITTVTSLAASAIVFAMAYCIGYPLPFTIVLGTPGECAGVVVCFIIVWRRYLTQNPDVLSELRNYLVLMSKQTTLTVIYPLFRYTFQSIPLSTQPTFTIVLPLLKLALKNFISDSIPTFQDLNPEVVILNVEIFHALYVAFCMQTATSMYTAALLMVIDFIHACSSLHRVNSMITVANSLLNRKIQQGEHPPANGVTSNDPASRSTVHPNPRHWRLISSWKSPSSVMPVDNTHHKDLPTPSLLAITQYALEIATSVRCHPSIRVQSHHCKSSSPSIDGIVPGSTPSALSEPQRVASSNSVRAIAPARAAVDDHSPSSRPSSTLTDADMRLVASCPSTERLRTVQRVLRLLYLTEFLLLTEYIEAMTPIVYCTYLEIVSHLSNRDFYANLKGVDDNTLHRNTTNILAYGALELLSFLLLSYVLGRKLHVPSIHQLAFVLETHWQLVQGMIVLWVIFSLETSLEHYGVDYSFRFAWLAH